MNATAIATSGRQTRAIQPPHPLARVMTWELLRFGASRMFWLQALGFFSFSLLITWASRAPSEFDVGNGNGGESIRGFVAGTSSLGLTVFTTSPLS